jgi:hypothetical protein
MAQHWRRFVGWVEERSDEAQRSNAGNETPQGRGAPSLGFAALNANLRQPTAPAGNGTAVGWIEKRSDPISDALRAITRFLGLKSGLLAAGLSLSPVIWAFDLPQLSSQLAAPEVIRGPFVQEKHLRALPNPLTSQGRFVLARDHGLLWLLQSPLQQDYRIDAAGVSRRTPAGWQRLPQQSAAAQQNRLFLAVLQGDSSGLQRDFELALSGTADAWRLTLTPRSALLKQIFDRIEIAGGALVERIELWETQGDRTVLRLPQSEAGTPLSETERHDLVD